MTMKDYQTIEATRLYLMKRCSEKLEILVIVGDGHFGSSPAQRKLTGMTLIAIPVKELLADESAILAIFAIHNGMTKTRVRKAREFRNALQQAGIHAEYMYSEENYENIPLDKNGTRATAIEKMACEWLGYKHTGSLNHSALYDSETNARLGRKGGRAVPDGMSQDNTSTLEVKCKRGRTTFISDCNNR